MSQIYAALDEETGEQIRLLQKSGSSSADGNIWWSESELFQSSRQEVDQNNAI